LFRAHFLGSLWYLCKGHPLRTLINYLFFYLKIRYIIYAMSKIICMFDIDIPRSNGAPLQCQKFTILNKKRHLQALKLGIVKIGIDKEYVFYREGVLTSNIPEHFTRAYVYIPTL